MFADAYVSLLYFVTKSSSLYEEASARTPVVLSVLGWKYQES